MTATNPVGRWSTDPDFETAADGTEYKTEIDNAILVGRRMNRAFAPQENSPADMKVSVVTGALFVDGVLTEKANQETPLFTAPTTDPRIDRIVLDELTGTISVVTGTEAPTPVAPAIPEGKRPCAQVSLTVGMTEITSQDISDERDPAVIVGASGVTILDKVTADTTVSATTTETDLYRKTVTGGTLQSDNKLTLELMISDLAVDSGDTITFRFKYGATTLVTVSDTAGATFNGGAALLIFELAGDGSTSAQLGQARAIFDATAETEFGDDLLFDNGSASEDSTANKDLFVTVQFSTTSVNNTITAGNGILKKAR